MTTSWQLIDETRERGCTLYNWFQLILVHTVFQFALFYKLHLHDALIRANISSMCHVSGLSHHVVSCTLQCKFTLRITHGAPLTTRLVFLAMLYLTVVPKKTTRTQIGNLKIKWTCKFDSRIKIQIRRVSNNNWRLNFNGIKTGWLCISPSM